MKRGGKMRLRMYRKIRQTMTVLLIIAMAAGMFPNHMKAAGSEGLSEAAVLEQLLLPYYLSEQDHLPMQLGDVQIRWTADQEIIDVSTGKITASEQSITEVNLEAEITLADNSTQKKDFSVQVLPKGSGYILGYTREKDDSMKRNGKVHGMYQSAVTDSLHLGYSGDGETFEPLNHNTGVLFAKNEGEKTKVLKQPFIFRRKDGGFGVLAVRMDEAGEAGDQKGKVLFFTSNDLISYEEKGLLTLSQEDSVQDPACVYDKVSDTYYITWTSGETGTGYVNRTVDFETVQEKEEFTPIKKEDVDSGITYAIEGNVVPVTPEEAKKIERKLKPVVNTEVENVTIQTEPGKAVDLSGVKVKAHYSDGSEADKSVTWDAGDLAKVDFSKEGTYEVKGTVRQLSDRISEAGNYPYIAGRADPNVIKFKGKYYFIATNEEGSGNVNLYMRESDTVAGLNDAEDHLVYDEAKGAEGNIVSKDKHWAPELHEIDGELYMFFASNIGTGWDVQSVIMKLRTGGDPVNYDDWEAPSRYLDQNGKVLNSMYGGITLDMTHFSYNDRHYVIWSQRNFGKNGGTADLWIGETTAENPGQLTSKPVMIVPCEYGWERNHTFVNEGPFVILTEDKLYLTYSGGATDETYCVGMTQIDLSDEVDFLDAASWKKTNYPVLTGLSSRGQDIYHGPGHNSYVTDEDGNLINVFHARPGDGGGFQRDTFLRIVHFGADGEPVLDLEEEVEILPENKNVVMTVVVEKKQSVSQPGVGSSQNTTGNGSQNTLDTNTVSITDERKDKLKPGILFEAGGMRYKVTGSLTAEFVKPCKKTNSKINIPAEVSCSGKKLKVTSIASKACLNNKNLKSVTIGKSVIKIGTKAFQGCQKLKVVHLKSSQVKKIGSAAFKKIHKKAVIKVPAKKLRYYKKLFKGKGLSKAAVIKK